MVRIIRRTVNNFGIYNYLKFIRKLNMIARLLSQFRATKILEFKRVSKQNIENRVILLQSDFLKNIKSPIFVSIIYAYVILMILL